MSVLTYLAQSSQYYSEYSDGYSTVSDGAAVAAVSAVLFTFLFFASIIAYVIYALLLGFIFKKAGVPQWVAWVPFYNVWKMLEIGGQPGFWAVLSIIPIVNIVSLVFIYIAMYNIGLRLQKEGWFVLLAIFLPLVWAIWLAFDGSKWQPAGGAATAKPVASTKA